MGQPTQAHIEEHNNYAVDFCGALQCLLLVGQQVRAVRGSEHWRFARNPDEIGTVVDVYIPTVTHQSVVVRFANGDTHLALHDVQRFFQ